VDINELIDKYLEEGYKYDDATAKVCQDIILLKISNSKFNKNITIKGGVVIHSISNDLRRATRDLDLDFIKYSLDDYSISNFIEILNNSDDEISIEIVGKIKELHQQDYDGKRVFLVLKDRYGQELRTKLDIGVEKNFILDQDEYYFNFNIIGKSAKLLINSKEQIFTEKLKSLLKLGLRSTRYKDIFDFYYLIMECDMDKNKLYICINNIIYNDENMKENNISSIYNRLALTLNSRAFKRKLKDPKVNWLDVPIDEAIDVVLNYVKELDRVSIS